MQSNLTFVAEREIHTALIVIARTIVQKYFIPSNWGGSIKQSGPIKTKGGYEQS